GGGAAPPLRRPRDVVASPRAGLRFARPFGVGRLGLDLGAGSGTTDRLARDVDLVGTVGVALRLPVGPPGPDAQSGHSDRQPRRARTGYLDVHRVRRRRTAGPDPAQYRLRPRSVGVPGRLRDHAAVDRQPARQPGVRGVVEPRRTADVAARRRAVRGRSQPSAGTGTRPYG